MTVVIITKHNIHLLQHIISKLPISYKYNINNNLITVLYIINDIPVGYGHLKKQNLDIILDIYVLKDFRNQTIGTILIDYLISVAKINNINMLQLYIGTHNDNAIHLANKKGFLKINENNSICYMELDINYILPISIGKALDKLSILYIKLRNIKDSKNLLKIKTEYDIISKYTGKYITNNKFLYNILARINLDIWKIKDEYNISKNTSLCKQLIDENDKRSRIKKKINHNTNYLFTEYNNFKLSKCVVYICSGFEYNVTSIGMIRYLSIMYDNVIIVCDPKSMKNTQLFYIDDPDIKIYPNLPNISGCENYDIFNYGDNSINCIPFNFYNNLHIEPSIFWDYFYISKPLTNLYNNIKDIQYVFVHNINKHGRVFDIKIIEDTLNISKDYILIVNPCINMYKSSHKFYNLANKFVYKQLIEYSEIIINATGVIVCDSPLFYMAINLNIKTDKCYYTSKNIDYIYNSIYNPKYRTFIQKFNRINL